MSPSSPSSPSPRRIVAIVLSRLPCELAEEHGRLLAVRRASAGTAKEVAKVDHREAGVREAVPLAVVLKDNPSARSVDSTPAANPAHIDTAHERHPEPDQLITAINAAARSYGVRVGQTVTEARAWVAHLNVHVLHRSELEVALQRVADALMRFAPTVSIGFPDTIWLDVTGVTGLFEGERGLLQELTSCLSGLGHFSRIAISRGPFLARAFARWSAIGRSQLGIIIEDELTEQRAARLPIAALPISADARAWLAQLGLLGFSDLARLPRDQVAPRLGPLADLALDLVNGKDEQPLHGYSPSETPSERSDWDEPTTNVQPLLFASRGLCSRIAARLEGRGLAARALSIRIRYDLAVTRFRNLPNHLLLECPLATPLFRPDDLWKIVASKLERTRLQSPCTGIEIEARALTLAHHRQLDLLSSTSKLDATSPERLQVLFSELATEVGPGRFGTLRTCNSHLPEKLSLLQPVTTATPRTKPSKRRQNRQQTLESAHLRYSPAAPRQHGPTTNSGPELAKSPNRVLNTPIALTSPLQPNALLTFAGQLYSVKDITFLYRLDCVEWWSGENISRDYARVTLEGQAGHIEVLVYKNRITNQRYFQAIYD